MSSVEELGRRAKTASRVLATAPTATKNAALITAADLLLERADDIQRANEADLAAARADGMDEGPLDRLRLTHARLEGMARGLRTVAALEDPVGEVLDGWVPPNRLEITRVRVPLGVVAIIYENRPNVTSDAAGLCLKSGNAALLRVRRARCARTSRSSRCCVRHSRSSACPRMRSCSSRTRRTTPRSRSCSSRTSSTA
jgi:glutamate-5-semialdehyde dehydrogenase